MLTDQAFRVLRASSLFSGFTDEQLAEVPKVALPHTFAPGDVIVKEGDAVARSVWLILEGDVEVKTGTKVLRVQGPGSHFGEMALFNDAPRSADVIAKTAVTALQLSRDHLRGLIHANPDVAMAMLGELSNRLRKLTELIADLVDASPETARNARERGVEFTSGVDTYIGLYEWGLMYGG